MITSVFCYINSFIIVFGGEGFIKNYDAAFWCVILELIITMGVLKIADVLKGVEND